MTQRHPLGRILSEKQLRDEKLAGASHGTRVALSNDPVDPLPPAITLSPRRVGWIEAEVDDWLERRRARRDSEEQQKADICARRPKHLQERA
jgi:predicted DNA-binding transcriptional regulator AlpA